MSGAALIFVPMALSPKVDELHYVWDACSDGESIRVFIRVRPLSTNCGDVDRGLCLDVSGTRILMQAKPEDKVFTFDDVADQQSTQESIFCVVGKKIIEGCVGGYNGTIFAYGQTGSGKTFTMLGPHEESGSFQHELRGVIPRSFDYLFKLLQKEQEVNGIKMEFMCKCTFLEIYNELVHDLLDPSSPSLQLRENIKRGIFVENLREVPVTSAADAYAVLNRGWSNRKVAETTMNHESSRSHAVFTVNIETKINKGGVWAIKSSQLHLVDLAGSERQKDTNTSGVRLKEAGSINRSLSTLGNVIMALVDISRGKSRHVPYRDSKLTFLLKDALGGNSRTCIIACVHPGSNYMVLMCCKEAIQTNTTSMHPGFECFGETLSTLQFAKRAKLIKNKAIVNEDMHGSVVHLQAEIKRLKELLTQSQISSSLQLSVVVDASDCRTSDQQVDERFKMYFIQSMGLWQQRHNDQEVLSDKCQCLEETIKRKDKALSQFKMILKFREEALRRIEKSVKEKSCLDSEDKDVIIENLRSEVRTFDSIVSHHPEAMKYKLENESLRSEIQRLRSLLAKDNNNVNVVELEKAFREIADLKGGIGSTSAPPASSPAGHSLISANAVERYKVQIEELEKKLAEVKADSAQQLQRLERQNIEAEAKIAGLERAKEEMEKFLQAHHVRSKIERHNLNDTIKIITTPKKSSRSSREDSSNHASSSSPGLALAALSPVRLILSDDDSECLTSETVPDQVVAQQLEGLQEELVKLQEQLATYEADLERKNQEVVVLYEEKFRLAKENELLDVMAEKNRASWLTSVNEMEQKIASLEKDNTDLSNNMNVSNSECQDLRLMNAASDRKVNELRSEIASLKSTNEKEISKLETNILKLTVEINELRETSDNLAEDYEQLKEQEENTRATLDFTTDSLQEVEAMLKSSSDTILQLRESLLESEKTIESLRREKELLLTQLKQETGEKDSQLLETMHELQIVQDDLTRTITERQSYQTRLGKLEKELSLSKAECEKIEAKKEEAINSLKSSIDHLREEIAQRDSDIVDQREKSSHRIKTLESTVETLNCQITSLESSHAVQLEKHLATISVRNAEIEMLQEDNESLSLRMDSFAQQVNDELNQKTRLTAMNGELRCSVDQLTVKIAELQEALDKAKLDQDRHTNVLSHCSILEAQLSELQVALDEAKLAQEQQPDMSGRCSLLENQVLELEIALGVAKLAQERETFMTGRCQVLEGQICQLQEAFDVVSTQHSSSMSEAESMKREVVNLKSILEETTCEQNKIVDSLMSDKVVLMQQIDYWEAECLQQKKVALSAQEDLICISKQLVEVQRLQSQISELHRRLELSESTEKEKDEEITRLIEYAQKSFIKEDEISTKCLLLVEENHKLKEQVSKLESDLEAEITANAKLTGHQNHAQRINYVERLKEQLINAEKKIRDQEATCERYRLMLAEFGQNRIPV